MIRRIHKNHLTSPGPGESVLRVPTTQYDSLGPDMCMRAHLPVAVLPNPRCAVINLFTNTVTRVINADDTLDVPPNAISTKYFNHPTVQVGWKWDGTTVTAPPPPPIVNLPIAQYDWPNPTSTKSNSGWEDHITQLM